MLTATFIQIQNVELPESDSKTVASTSIAVTIEKSGVHFLNGKEVSVSRLEREITEVVSQSDNIDQASITIVAEIGVPFENVSRIMSIANKLRLNAILATQPRKG
jgi:biopolymer transport protein ExbD